jgi:hypothetical protein
MLRVRKADDRGRAKHGWLSSRHAFSFGGATPLTWGSARFG